MSDPHAVTTRAGPAGFATTEWGTVLAAGQGNSTEAAGALARLCQAYWYPLYGYLRHRGFNEPDAKDLTQGFFEQLLAQNSVAKAEPGRGRFRSFLLKSLQHYIANVQRDARRLKRGGGQPLVALDADADIRYRLEPAHSLSPDKLYDRRWAMTVIATALRKLREDYAAAGQTDLYEELEGSLTGNGRGARLSDIGQRLGLSEEAVKVAAHRMRKRFGRVLRETVLDTVQSPAEVDAELSELQSVIQEGLTTIWLPTAPGNLSRPMG